MRYLRTIILSAAIISGLAALVVGRSASEMLLVFCLGMFLLSPAFYVLHFVWRVVRGEREEKDNLSKALDKDPRFSILAVFAGISVIAVLIVGSFDDKPEYKVTAQQIFSEFSANELAAHNKYFGKKVQVRGQFIESGVSFGNPYILLFAGGRAFTVQCFLENKSDISRAGSLIKNTDVLVVGKVAEKMLNVMLQDCSFATSE